MEEHLESVEKLVTKRLKNFEYIKRVYKGTAPWLNTVFLTKEDIYHFYAREKKDVSLDSRAEQWFYVGISLAPVLSLQPGQPYVGAISAFWDEFESSGASKGRTKEQGTSARPSSSNNEYLNTPNIPSNLDYFEVIYTLCDLLEHVYKKFMAVEISTQTAKMIVKIDSRFKHHVISPISKDTTALAVNILKQQMNAIDSIFGSSGWEEGSGDD